MRLFIGRLDCTSGSPWTVLPAPSAPLRARCLEARRRLRLLAYGRCRAHDMILLALSLPRHRCFLAARRLWWPSNARSSPSSASSWRAKRKSELLLRVDGPVAQSAGRKVFGKARPDCRPLSGRPGPHLARDARLPSLGLNNLFRKQGASWPPPAPCLHAQCPLFQSLVLPQQIKASQPSSGKGSAPGAWALQSRHGHVLYALRHQVRQIPQAAHARLLPGGGRLRRTRAACPKRPSA